MRCGRLPSRSDVNKIGPRCATSCNPAGACLPVCSPRFLPVAHWAWLFQADMKKLVPTGPIFGSPHIPPVMNQAHPHGWPASSGGQSCTGHSWHRVWMGLVTLVWNGMDMVLRDRQVELQHVTLIGLVGEPGFDSH